MKHVDEDEDGDGEELSIGETFKLLRELRREKSKERMATLDDKLELLRQRGWSIQFLYEDTHIRIAGLVDWWPATDRWRQFRGNRPAAYGFEHMVYRIAKLIAEAQDAK